MRTASALSLLLAAATPGAPQEVDATDPLAVARAYIEACQVGDAETALGLIEADDPLLPTLREWVEGRSGGPREKGFSFAIVFTEFMSIPMRLDLAAADPVVEVAADGSTQITIRRTLGIDQRLVMAQADDGTWAIKAHDSVQATTGPDRPLLRRLVGSDGRAHPPGEEGAPPARVSDSESRLRQLARAFSAYADDHDNMLPPAATWMDEIEPYVLDPDTFRCPAAPDREYGYAMNAFAGGVEVPQNWDDRRNLIILFEWRDAERNQVAFPDLLAEVEPLWDDGATVMVDAAQETRRLFRGVTVDEMILDGEHRSMCERNLSRLVAAALAFVRQNEGLLPSADTWQDDIAPYLLEQGAGEDPYRCPAGDQIEFAYAINADIAGKDARTLRGHEHIALFFECDKDVISASGYPRTDASSPGRHLNPYDTGRQNAFGLLSGDTTWRPGRPATGGAEAG